MKKHLTNPVSIAPLAVFRVLFGFIMLVSTIRFAAKGWIYQLYIEPDYFFTFYGFDWVVPLGGFGMYALFAIIGLAATGIMLGYRYRVSAVLFFFAFTYVELIDKTNYLNHYYFVSIVSFLLIWVPANRFFSLDVLRDPDIKVAKVPAWTVNIFKLQLAIVYIFAGAAKLNYDWLVNAMPLKIWLPANAHLPLIGELLNYSTTAYFFSWAGAFYDLTIVLFLLWKRTRIPAYMAVVVFHMFTWFLFQIGMFPFIMILCTLIYFSEEFHEKVIQKTRRLWHFLSRGGHAEAATKTSFNSSLQLNQKTSTIISGILILHFCLQLLIPLRFMLYPGNLFWTEQGFRFSWRVMLMEKAGHATFYMRNPDTDNKWQIRNWDYLTPNQEKMMSTQPDMILQYAHYLEREYRKNFSGDVEITVESYVTLNGRRSQLLADPEVDLTQVKRGFAHKDWILPLNNQEKNWFGNL